MATGRRKTAFQLLVSSKAKKSPLQQLKSGKANKSAFGHLKATGSTRRKGRFDK